jgi:hypothetical protein
MSRTDPAPCADWHRYLHDEGILVPDEGEECGPWHHRVFLGASATPPTTEGLDVERARAEIQANRKQGVKWEPPVDPKMERWYAEGYDRGLRDADAILARLGSTQGET